MRLVAAVVLSGTLVSCKGCEASNGVGAPAATASASASSNDRDVVAPSASVTPSLADAAVDEVAEDAGASSCPLTFGPAEQPFRGPAALQAVSRELRLIVNDGGKPRIYPVPIPSTSRGAAPVVPPRPGSFVGMRWPPCELAGRFAYCQGPGGVVTRSFLEGVVAPKVVAKSRAGTRIAAASLGGDHSVAAFLDLRRTTEGDMLQAFAVLDEQEPVKVSDDGAGATTLRFLARGESPVLVYLDARTAMVPVHARLTSLHEGNLSLGPDVVVFVGGAPERGIDFAVASAGPSSLAFVPMPRETLDFGMATLLLGDPLKEDAKAVWSKYPNGLDPAPIAATPSRDGKTAWVARVRPRERAATSPRILELGKVDAAGAFSSLGEIAPAKGVTDIAIAEDVGGGVWILYGDSSVTWLERRMCGG